VLIPWLSPLPSQEDTTLVRWEQLGGRQVPASLRARITLRIDELSLETALQLIAQEADLKLSYNHSQLPLKQAVSLRIQDASVLEALLVLLEQTGAELLITERGQLAIVPGEQQENRSQD
jgi:hypothetical protein